jgi:hypothetical protein
MFQETHLIHNRSLLLQRHGNRVLVAVAVQTDFVPGVGDHATFFGEGFERVAGDEPSCFDVVAFEHCEQAADADRAGEQTT